MIIKALILVPFFAGLLSFFLRWDRACRILLLLAAAIHTTLCIIAWYLPPGESYYGWFMIDPLGFPVLTITSVLFLVVSWYATEYLQVETTAPKLDIENQEWAQNEPQSVFVGCLLIFLSAMTLVAVTQHLGVMWVAVEATTLASAPLIYFHRHARSLEAAWKYLLICGVGIALALLGNYFLIIAGSHTGQEAAPMLIGEIIKTAGTLNHVWLKAAFIFFLVGYGTKMGLAPMHTWLPDAHSQAPSLVSALLSGALLNCAFLALLRTHQICVAAGLGEFSGHILMSFGLLSMAWAAIFIVRQSDYKRLLAYSSVEHMGILSLGAGLGPMGLGGAMLHAVSHSFTKGMLFMLAGNILAAYQSKRVSAVRGMKRTIPATGLLWMLGFLAISGMPPFGIFMSKFTILTAAMQRGEYLVGSLFAIILVTIFIGMANVFLGMFFGEADAEALETMPRERLEMIGPPAVLLGIVLVLGLYVPPFVMDAIAQAGQFIGAE